MLEEGNEHWSLLQRQDWYMVRCVQAPGGALKLHLALVIVEITAGQTHLLFLQ